EKKVLLAKFAGKKYPGGSVKHAASCGPPVFLFYFLHIGCKFIYLSQVILNNHLIKDNFS
ncbi:MAG: hypothetical protein OER59_08865, partial [Desulfobulbaceae bacterium]|nr:hypothetical protein [Desulfobulbaceae bacterium]